MQEIRALRGRRSAKQTMRRSASEAVRNLETRIARLEKSAYNHDGLPKRVQAELEELLSDDPFYNDMREYYWGEVKIHNAKELEYLEDLSHIGERFHLSRYEVEATISFNELIVDDAEIVNPRAKLYHFVDEALDHADFGPLRVIRSSEVQVKSIGTPKLINSPRDISRLLVPVKLVLVADNGSDFFHRRANSHLASTRKVAGHIVLAGTVNVRQLRRILRTPSALRTSRLKMVFLLSSCQQWTTSRWRSKLNHLLRSMK